MSSVKGVVCHWTATPDTTRPADNYPSKSIVTFGRSGLPGPLCNLGLGRDGTVFLVAAGLAYHAGSGYYQGIGANGNANTIGIEAEEGGDGDWTPAMLDAYPRLCAALARFYKLPTGRVIGHNEWAPSRKIDIRSWPGGMAGFRTRVQSIINGSAAPATPKPSTSYAELYGGDHMETLPAGGAEGGIWRCESIPVPSILREHDLVIAPAHDRAVVIHRINTWKNQAKPMSGPNNKNPGGSGSVLNDFVVWETAGKSVILPQGTAKIDIWYRSDRPFRISIAPRP
ncbi:peptidoglycan recognition protein family protein [Prauserella endophytica]|uniref:N-acetylmuramoyl-L-alanine amidase n=1 Tax=Prauserella endophytica TaxID=1592324 RepID=A0ABY2S008_9PSEU|nr:N-acetylmuramoyl-L-alanine amidase [Prauserella endophytica]PXY20319.1 hypothetical protein BAY59_31255 [Prauserella coralliicola]TKG66921.1 N-acetylmuramoyl-L-alanine amidase [Prauserella endophytica]